MSMRKNSAALLFGLALFSSGCFAGSGAFVVINTLSVPSQVTVGHRVVAEDEVINRNTVRYQLVDRSIYPSGTSIINGPGYCGTDITLNPTGQPGSKCIAHYEFTAPNSPTTLKLQTVKAFPMTDQRVLGPEHSIKVTSGPTPTPVTLTLSPATLNLISGGAPQDIIVTHTAGADPARGISVTNLGPLKDNVNIQNNCQNPLELNHSCTISMQAKQGFESPVQKVVIVGDNTNQPTVDVTVSKPAPTPVTLKLSPAALNLISGGESQDITVTHIAGADPAQGIKFQSLGSLEGNVTPQNNCVAPLVLGATCTLSLKANAGFIEQNQQQVVIGGQNTNQPTIGVTVSSGGGTDSIQVQNQVVLSGLNVAQDMILLNTSLTQTAHVTNIAFVLPPTIFNVPVPAIPASCANVLPQHVCNVPYVTSSADATGHSIVTYTYNFGGSNLQATGFVSVANASIGLFDSAGIRPIRQILLQNDGNTTTFVVKNLGTPGSAFNWINPKITFLQTPPGVTIPVNTCTSTVPPGGQCTFGLQTNTTSPTGNGQLTITGDNANIGVPVITQGGTPVGNITITVDKDSDVLHLGYRPLLITNTGSTPFAISSITVNSPPTVGSHLLQCLPSGTTSCPWYTNTGLSPTPPCPPSGLLPGNGRCLIWLGASQDTTLDIEQSTLSGQGSIDVNGTFSSSSAKKTKEQKPGLGFHVTFNVNYSQDLYAAGNFSSTISTTPSDLAKWNGGWTMLGTVTATTPGAIPTIKTLASIDGDLYAGGLFDSMGYPPLSTRTPIPAGSVIKWNGDSFLGQTNGFPGLSGDSITSFASSLAKAGSLFAAGAMGPGGADALAGGVAFFDPTSKTWSSFVNGPLNNTTGGSVYALISSGFDGLVAGGFTADGLNPFASGVSQIVINSLTPVWQSVGSAADLFATGNPDGVLALAAGPGSFLFAGGDTSGTAGILTHGIGRWSGTSWAQEGDDLYNPNPIDNSSGGRVNALLFNNGTQVLYAGGTATDPAKLLATGVVSKNLSGTTWNAVGSFFSPMADTPVTGYISALAQGKKLFAGGEVTSVPVVGKGKASPARHLGAWDGSNWTYLDDPAAGSFDYVTALVIAPSLVLN